MNKEPEVTLYNAFDAVMNVRTVTLRRGNQEITFTLDSLQDEERWKRLIKALK